MRPSWASHLVVRGGFGTTRLRRSGQRAETAESDQAQQSDGCATVNRGPSPGFRPLGGRPRPPVQTEYSRPKQRLHVELLPLFQFDRWICRQETRGHDARAVDGKPRTWGSPFRSGYRMTWLPSELP
jgi:hypothetical protein